MQSMSIKNKRRPWQLHLSTTILLTLVAGALLGLNSAKRIEPIFVPDITVGNGTYPVRVKAYSFVQKCGWPLAAELTEEGYHSTQFIHVLQWNTAISLGILLFAGIVYEYRTRRMERAGSVLSSARLMCEFGLFILVGAVVHANLTFYVSQCAVVMGWPLAFDGYYDAASVYNRDDLDVLASMQLNRASRMVVDILISVSAVISYILICYSWIRKKT